MQLKHSEILYTYLDMVKYTDLVNIIHLIQLLLISLLYLMVLSVQQCLLLVQQQYLELDTTIVFICLSVTRDDPHTT